MKKLGGPNERNAYSDCAATEDHIFGLFSGKAKHAFPSAARQKTEFIHVFGWAGEFVGVIQLDHEAFTLAFDDSGRYLYTGADEPTPGIRVTDLIDVLGSLRVER